jgi:class 3 adenylate cyclase
MCPLNAMTSSAWRAGPGSCATRVAALAQANEVLVTSTVQMLVLGSGISFTDRGEHALKGLPGRWQLFAVQQT